MKFQAVQTSAADERLTVAYIREIDYVTEGRFPLMSGVLQLGGGARARGDDVGCD